MVLSPAGADFNNFKHNLSSKFYIKFQLKQDGEKQKLSHTKKPTTKSLKKKIKKQNVGVVHEYEC